ncbi:MAG: acyltransferase [Chitinophagaceae bacterium]|nr:MAG: acyltransferase [Chitinophagaceae bacterium]
MLSIRIEKAAVPVAGKDIAAGTGRMPWVDYARALAIMLVVYRHTMVGLDRSGLAVPSFLYNIQEFLFNVRMPVFFVLSGIFLGRSVTHRGQGYMIWKKAANLLYPYLVWTFIFITIQILLSGYTNATRTTHDYWYILTDPRELDHMWYLVSLFTTSVLLILVAPVLVKRPVLHLLLATGFHFVHPFVVKYSLLFYTSYYYIFLCIGVQASSYIRELDKRDSRWLWKLLLLSLPFFIAGQLFWMNNIADNYKPLQDWYLLPFLVIILVACVVYYCVSRLLYNAGILRWMNTLGRASLYIYILHLLVISSFRMACLKILHINNVYVILGGSLLLGIIIPVLVYRLSKRWTFIHRLFSLDKQKGE